ASVGGFHALLPMAKCDASRHLFRFSAPLPSALFLSAAADFSFLSAAAVCFVSQRRRLFRFSVPPLSASFLSDAAPVLRLRICVSHLANQLHQSPLSISHIHGAVTPTVHKDILPRVRAVTPTFDLAK
ncbi:hypothetical protein RYX36_013297, partial [Vicia faba]